MKKNSPLKFGSESLYRLKIQGKISDSWNDQIGPLKITQEVIKDGVHITTLIFNTRDQAELLGILNIIYEKHLPILDLSRIKERKD